MSLLDGNSAECLKSEVDFFSVPPTQTCVEKGQWVECQPVSLMPDHGPIEFRVPGSDDLYLDLSQTVLKVTAKIVKKDGTALVAADAVSPTNLTLHSLFSQVDVSLNQRLVSASSPTYAYRAYLETLLNYGKGAKNGQLQAALYYKDTAGHFDDATILGANAGLKARRLFTERSQSVDMEGRLHVDLLHQEKYLLNRVDLTVRMTRAPNAFSLMVGDDEENYKWVIEEAVLKLRKVHLSDALRLAQEERLMRENAKIPINRVLCNVYSIPAGIQTYTKDNLFQGQLPKRLVVTMVDNDAFNGAFKKNPFKFKHNQLSGICLYVDNEAAPAEPMRLNFDCASGNRYVSAYMSLFHGGNTFCVDTDNDISRNDFGNGYTMFAFDLTPDLSNSNHLSLLKNANLKLQLNFATPLGQTTILLVYAEFDNLIEITKDHAVLYDYAN